MIRGCGPKDVNLDLQINSTVGGNKELQDKYVDYHMSVVAGCCTRNDQSW